MTQDSIARDGSYPTAAEARLLRAVLNRPGIVRGELVEAVGSASSGAVDSIRGLLRRGSLQSSGSAPSSGGRPATRLTVSPHLAIAFAHCACGSGLRSAVVGADGSLLATEVGEPPTAAAIKSQIEGLELRWGKEFPHTVAGSALSLPGVPHPAHTKQGKAPWLFGASIVDLTATTNETQVVTHAESLLRAEAVREPGLSGSLSVAIDLNDGASSVLQTPEGSRVPLNLIALEGPEWIFSKQSFAERVETEARRPDTLLGELLSESSPCDALREAEQMGDVVANRIVDDATLELGKFLSRLARLLRPEHMVVSAWLFAKEICRPDEVKRIVRRSCPPGTAARLTFRHSVGDEWTHCVGAGLCAIEHWLWKLEQGKA